MERELRQADQRSTGDAGPAWRASVHGDVCRRPADRAWIFRKTAFSSPIGPGQVKSPDVPRVSSVHRAGPQRILRGGLARLRDRPGERLGARFPALCPRRRRRPAGRSRTCREVTRNIGLFARVATGDSRAPGAGRGVRLRGVPAGPGGGDRGAAGGAQRACGDADGLGQVAVLPGSGAGHGWAHGGGLAPSRAVEHPPPLVQSAAMAAVPHPAPAYRPMLPERVVTEGLLSDVAAGKSRNTPDQDHILERTLRGRRQASEFVELPFAVLRPRPCPSSRRSTCSPGNAGPSAESASAPGPRRDAPGQPPPPPGGSGEGFLPEIHNNDT